MTGFCSLLIQVIITFSSRDRLIRHPESFQATHFIPKIRKHSASPAVSAKVALSPTNSTQPPPTFRQFIQFLLATPVSSYDAHWFPYWLQCTPCSIKYDAVLKMETMAVSTNIFFLLRENISNQLLLKAGLRRNTKLSH